MLLIGVSAALLVLCFIGFAMLRNPWLQALDAVTLAIVSAQLGFQLYDAGHHQMLVGSGRTRSLAFSRRTCCWE